MNISAAPANAWKATCAWAWYLKARTADRRAQAANTKWGSWQKAQGSPNGSWMAIFVVFDSFLKFNNIFKNYK
jgi:hypothetical protein